MEKLVLLRYFASMSAIIDLLMYVVWVRTTVLEKMSRREVSKV